MGEGNMWLRRAGCVVEFALPGLKIVFSGALGWYNDVTQGETPIIPSFAVSRTRGLLFYFEEMKSHHSNAIDAGGVLIVALEAPPGPYWFQSAGLFKSSHRRWRSPSIISERRKRWGKQCNIRGERHFSRGTNLAMVVFKLDCDRRGAA
jgi:hypothetical protein